MANTNLENSAGGYPAYSQDYEFIDISFNGIHSSAYGLTAVFSSDMYREKASSIFEDKVVEVPGKAGAYYFGTEIKPKTFEVSFGFDSLTAEQKRSIQQWLNPKTVGKLIFSQTPYKYYYAKLAATPEFSFVPFEELTTSGLKHVYKGSIDVSFVCYDPYGYSDYSNLNEVLVWNGTTDAIPSPLYLSTTVPGWSLESGISLADAANLADCNKSGGYALGTWASSLANGGTWLKDFYNGGTVEEDVSLTFTVANIGAGKAIKIKNLTNGTEFIMKDTLPTVANAHAVVYSPKTGICTALINGELRSIWNVVESDLKVSPGSNIFALTHYLVSNPATTYTTLSLTNVNVSFKYKYI